MYQADVVQMRQFYSSHLGRVVRHHLGAAIARHWPEIGSDLVMGLGYANPMLRHYLKSESAQAMQLVPAMPAQQGAIYWPQHSSNRATLVHGGQLPFASNVFNRILMVHALETAQDTESMLAECWRVLTPGGRMLVVVPNRRGWWASAMQTPFSNGQPYHAAQLRDLLCRADFTLIDTSYGLHCLPLRSRGVARLAGILEALIRAVLPRMGGVVIMEVEKQIYAGIKEAVPRYRHHPAYAKRRTKPVMTQDIGA